MNFESDHYEIDELWDEKQFGDNEMLRLNETISLIPNDIDNILDVGCGNGLFLKRLKILRPKINFLYGCDRSITALKRVIDPHARVEITALPFHDSSFDLVTSLQVFEHLNDVAFNRARSEASRVSRKYLLISVPFEEDLESQLVKCPQCHSHFNPYLHLRSFSKFNMEHLFDDFGFEILHLHCLGPYEDMLGWKSIRRFLLPHVTDDSPYSFAMPCPICGVMIPSKTTIPLSRSQMTHLSPRMYVKPIIKRLWPKSLRHSRIAACYIKKR